MSKTVYIAPTAQGSADGTSAANAYAYSSLDSAESDAGNNGIIYFTDGTYAVGNETWDPLVDNMTYKALNQHKAILNSTGTVTLRFGSNSATKNVIFENFKVTGSISYRAQSNAIMKRILHIDTRQSLAQYGSFNTGTGEFTITDSSFIFDRAAGPQYLFNGLHNGTMNRCTIFNKCTALSANELASSNNSPACTNTIISTDNSSAVASSAITPASFTNSCLFNLHSGHTSGGTDNIFEDPQFLDSANGDLRLRPSSPCIGLLKSRKELIQSKYSNAIWFDSAHAGTESGTIDEPYNTISEAMTAASDGGVIGIKNGSHNVGAILLNKSLTFIGESTKAVLMTSGASFTGSISARGTSHSINLNTLKIYHNSTSTTYGLIHAGNTADATITVDSCVLEMGPLTLAAPNRGFFAGAATPVTKLTVINSVISGGSTTAAGVVVGGDHHQDGFNSLDFQDNTIVVTGGSSQLFSSYSGGILSSIFKGNIFVGNGNSETLGFVPIVVSGNCYHNTGINSANAPDSEGAIFADPLFLDAANGDYRLRPSSPCIGGAEKSKFPLDAIWIEAGSGNNGSGTESDPFSWSDQYSEAFLATVQSTSKQLIFKDGTYLWSNSIIRDDNVGNAITFVSQNKFQAIHTDNGRLNSDGKNPTLRFKDCKIEVYDHFTYGRNASYEFDGCWLTTRLYIIMENLKAKGTIFEVAEGSSLYPLSVYDYSDVQNCIFVDHNDRTSTYQYLASFGADGVIKNCIFYKKGGGDVLAAANTGVSMINCAGQNVNDDRLVFQGDLGFIDIDNKNYSLKLSSPILG